MDAANTPIPHPAGFACFADWLRAATAQRGAQAALARAAGCTPQAVTKWLTGHQVTTANLQRIAAWAGVDYLDLRALLDGATIVRTTAMQLPDPDLDLLTGLVSAHILDLNGQLLRRPDLTPDGRDSYARQIEAAHQTLRRLNDGRARQQVAA